MTWHSATVDWAQVAGPNSLGCRSRLQPFISTLRAWLPVIEIVVRAWLTSVRDRWCVVASLVNAESILLLGVRALVQQQHAVAEGMVFKQPTIQTVVGLGLTARLVNAKTGVVEWVGAATTQDESMQRALSRISEGVIYSMLGKKIPKEFRKG